MAPIPLLGTYPVEEGGIGRADMQSKPDKILKGCQFTWDSNGINYQLYTLEEPEFTMEKAVQFAEQFMAAQE